MLIVSRRKSDKRPGVVVTTGRIRVSQTRLNIYKPPMQIRRLFRS